MHILYVCICGLVFLSSVFLNKFCFSSYFWCGINSRGMIYSVKSKRDFNSQSLSLSRSLLALNFPTDRNEANFYKKKTNYQKYVYSLFFSVHFAFLWFRWKRSYTLATSWVHRAKKIYMCKIFKCMATGRIMYLVTAHELLITMYVQLFEMMSMEKYVFTI